MKRKLLVTLILVFLVCIVVAPAFAADQLEDETPDMDGTGEALLSAIHPSSSTVVSARSATFNASQGGYLTNITVSMKSFGSANGYVGCRVAGVTTFDSYASRPNSTVYAESINQINVAELAATEEYTNCTFQFDQTYQLVEGEKYTFYVYYASGLVPTVYLKFDSVSDHGSYTYGYKSGSWSSGVTSDVRFSVHSDTAAAGTPAEEPTTDPTIYDALITNFVSFIVPILVIMLPVVLLIIFTRSTDKWIILIGITIGAALGYFFNLVPMWVVFLVVIGLIGMAYQSVKGGG